MTSISNRRDLRAANFQSGDRFLRSEKIEKILDVKYERAFNSLELIPTLI